MANDLENFEPDDLQSGTSTSDANSDSDATQPPNPSNANNAADADRDPFEELASEFSERYRNGEMPSVEEYVEKHPELAEEIRDLFPTIAAMEQLKERKAPAKPASGGLELEQLGDFRILGEIGRGGMGVVYEAEQVSLGRHVAVKVLPKQALLDERHLRRFEREAQTAAKLHHTNIVPVFGVGQQDGFHYIVMQFIPGVGLDEILVALRTMVLDDDAPEYRVDSSSRASHANHNAKALLDGNFSKHAIFSSSFTKDAKSNLTTSQIGGTDATMELPSVSSRLSTGGLSGSSISAVPASEPSKIKTLDEDNSRVLASLDREYYLSVAKIGQQVADALAYAHEQGTLHRDIKPGNLLLDGTGTVWVADFGLAKLAEQDNVSRTGDLVGTLSYMPPESFSGDADARGDIYALGLTLFEMLAMRPAYYGRDRAKLVKQITEGELPRLAKLNPAVPRDLETIVLKAIAHRPEDRYATARDLEEDMQNFLHDIPIKARRMSVPEQFTRWCRKNKLVAGLSAAVLSLLILSSVTFGVLYRQAAKAFDAADTQRIAAEKAEGRAEDALGLAVERKKIADEARNDANEIATVAIGELFKRFNDIVSERLPLSTDQSLAVAFSDGDTTDQSDDELSTDANELAGDTEENVATVADAPITAETAIQAEKYLESFEVLANRTLKADEFAPIFADLTIRVGKIQRLLGNNAEAMEKFDSGIEKYEAIVDHNPSPSAIIGLASSYNEKGDVITLTSHPLEAFSTFDKARKLFEKHEILLADSPRAKYEEARTLFLMSMEYRASPGQLGGSGGPRFGGPGSGPGGRSRGGGRGQRRGNGARGESGRGESRRSEMDPRRSQNRSGEGGPGRGGENRRPGGPGTGGRGRGSAIFAEMFQGRVERLQKAIALLEPLVETEANPEYRYLLARCHTAVALHNRDPRKRDERIDSIHDALKLLEQLVVDQPNVADYKFELAIAKFFGLDIEDTPIREREKAIEEIVALTSAITSSNPAISNYAFVHARAMMTHAETLDRLANETQRRNDDGVLELRAKARETTAAAVANFEDVRNRFPQIKEAFGSRFPSMDALRSLQHHTSAKYSLVAADLLKEQGKKSEATTMLTAARNSLREIVDQQAGEIEFDMRRRNGLKLSDSLKSLCAVEMRLSDFSAVKSLLAEIIQQRKDAATSYAFPQHTQSSVGEIKFFAAEILSSLGKTKAAEQLFAEIEADVKPLLKEDLDFDRFQQFREQPPTDEEIAKFSNLMKSRYLLGRVYEETGRNEERNAIYRKWRFFGRSGGRGGDRQGRERPVSDKDN